uniref:NADH dehydrogenase [ubiquinone] 1 alpha subcomplex subunit 11 n=1 Tax=Apteryx owenii TaxID=8824 RepID=A0A8B9P112_APTOW
GLRNQTAGGARWRRLRGPGTPRHAAHGNGCGLFSVAGLVGSAYRIILFQPKSVLAALQMAATDSVTMATLGAVFGLTTCLSAQIREEPEDPLNYFIGGCATGAVLGARAHSYMTGTTACLGFGITAALMKIGKKEGWRLVGPPKL